jgi:Ni,Fe-hydrogenase III large subunit
MASAERSRPAALEPRSLLPGRVRGTFEPAPAGEFRVTLALTALDRGCEVLIENGARLVGLFESGIPEPSLLTVFAFRGELVSLRAPLATGERNVYASISLHTPSALWAERELFDRFGIVPLGHPDLRPLSNPDPDEIRRRVEGDDVFVFPYGPIRSGVFEAIQFQIETGGEDIPALETRPFFKHRALEERMVGMTIQDAALVAERIAGIASVAHATAFSQAVERALGVEPPARALAWRVVYAELERVANHLDIAAKQAETTALSVGQARFMILKENVLRLQAALTGSRFARGMVRPGGVRAEGGVPVAALRDAADRFESELRGDVKLFLGTASMTDRLIGSGSLTRETVERFGAVGPVARGSGVSTDARFERPYGQYGRAGFEVVTRHTGDAMARVEVRFGEIRESLHLIRQMLDRLRGGGGELGAQLSAGSGAAFGWSEAPQGELVYWVEVVEGLIQRVRIASPSFRNWQLYSEAYNGDVLTDVGFIEHSFGLTPAGADR